MTTNYLTKKEAVASKEELPRTREEALAQDTKFYYPLNEPCPKNHDSPRDAMNDNRCVVCLIEKNQKQRAKPSAWVESADAAERKARNRAKKLGALPEDYDMKACREFYRLARQFTMKKIGGTTWEVDHEVPLTRGGVHRSDNLLVVSREVNADKGTLTPPEYLLKLSTGETEEAISSGKLFVREMEGAISSGKSIGEQL